MRTHRLTTFVALMGVALGLLGGLRGDPSAWAQAVNPCAPGQPCFSDVPDILHGERHLLRIDDLVVTGVWNPNTQALGALLPTSNTTITQATSSRLNVSIGGTCASSPETVDSLSNAVAVGGRMFNLDHDVVLSAVAQNNRTNPNFEPNCDVVVFADPDGLPVPAIFVPSGFAYSAITQLYAAVADFTGDGYDEIVLAGLIPNAGTGMLMQVLTAVDPDNPSQGVKAGDVGGPFGTSAQVFTLTTGIFQAPSPGQTPPPPLIAQLSTNASSGKGLEIGFFSVDPSSLAVNYTGRNIILTLDEEANADVVAGPGGRPLQQRHVRPAGRGVYGAGPLRQAHHRRLRCAGQSRPEDGPGHHGRDGRRPGC
jgi:hypothetical protein